MAFGGTDGYEGPPGGAKLTGDQTRTIEVWAWNEELAGEETLVAWGVREAGAGKNMAFNFGRDPSYRRRRPLEHATSAGDTRPLPNTWCHLVYTYDGEHARVFYNGSLMADLSVELDTPRDEPIRIGGQNGADGQWAIPATLSIARVRVHSGALTPAEVTRQLRAPGRGVRRAARTTSCARSASRTGICAS